MTQNEKTAARTATAGDGGERTWHRDGALLYTLKPHVNQFGRSRGKMVNDVTVRVEGPDAETIAAEIHARLAQLNPAGPVGEEALREASEKAWLAYRYGSEECRGPGWTDPSASSAWDAAWEARGALSPHPTTGQETVAPEEFPSEAQLDLAMDAFYPGENWRVDLGAALDNSRKDMRNALRAGSRTTGQETVATPRDGGVREALEAYWNGHGIDRHDAQHAFRAGYAAAISAPGSAGPGETPPRWKLVPADPTEEMQAAGWIDKEDVSPREIYWAMLAAAPTPPHAQEPGTGDTGKIVPHEATEEMISSAGAYICERLSDHDDFEMDEVWRRFLAATPATKAETPGPAEGAR